MSRYLHLHTFITDSRRWNPSSADALGRNSASSPLLFVPQGGREAAIEHGWQIIQQTATAIITQYEQRLLATAYRGDQVAQKTRFVIMKACKLIGKITPATRMTFNELAERIVELARYPLSIIRGWPELDSRLDDLKMAANFPALEAASGMYARFYKLLGPSIKGTDSKKGVTLPPELVSMIHTYTMEDRSADIEDIFFRIARMDRIVTPDDIERVRWLVTNISSLSLRILKGKVYAAKKFRRVDTANRDYLKSVKGSSWLRDVFKTRRGLRYIDPDFDYLHRL